MTLRNVERGITAIKNGNHVEGARLLKIALRDESLQGEMRALSYLWLAETKIDRQEKIECYNSALMADPGNEHAQKRLALLGATPPPPPTTTPGAMLKQPPSGVPGQERVAAPQAAPSARVPGVQDVQNAFPATPATSTSFVSVQGGPNGPATAFFVTRDGLLATTRYVVGGEEEITLQLASGERQNAQVVRSYPELDLAFIYSSLSVNQLPSPYNMPNIPPNMPLTAMAFSKENMLGHVRPTRSSTSPDWFPTTIEDLSDAGGNPVFNDQNLLVGMLTHNSNRTSPYVYGLNINTIFRYAEHYLEETRNNRKALLYCTACGSLSRAGTVGGYYCEICGNLLSPAYNVNRRPQPQLAAFYGENVYRACPNCDARVGYYDNECLRCGYEVTNR